VAGLWVEGGGAIRGGENVYKYINYSLYLSTTILMILVSCVPKAVLYKILF